MALRRRTKFKQPPEIFIFGQDQSVLCTSALQNFFIRGACHTKLNDGNDLVASLSQGVQQDLRYMFIS